MSEIIREHETLAPYHDDSWYWPVLEEYRDREGRALVECDLAWLAGYRPEEFDRYKANRQWWHSPKPARDVTRMLEIIAAFRNPIEPFRYLEFGTCWGTTLVSVLRRFTKTEAVGLEVNPYRYDVSCFMSRRAGVEGRADLRNESVFDLDLAPASLDVVYMDTNHTDEDYDYVLYVLNSGWLRPRWLFIGDDPDVAGTKTSRERFIAEFGDRYKIITRPDLNLWWFWG